MHALTHLKRRLRSLAGKVRWTREERLERATLYRLSRILSAPKKPPYVPTPEDFVEARNQIENPSK